MRIVIVWFSVFADEVLQKTRHGFKLVNPHKARSTLKCELMSEEIVNMDTDHGASHAGHAITPADAMIDAVKNPPSAPRKKKAQLESTLQNLPQQKSPPLNPTALNKQFHADEGSDDEIENTFVDDKPIKAPVRNRLSKRADGQLDLQNRSKRDRDRNTTDSHCSESMGGRESLDQQSVNGPTTVVSLPKRL